MKKKYYISFLVFTIILIVLMHLLLNEIDHNAGWRLEALPATGIIISVIIMLKIFHHFMKSPQGKQQS